MGTKTSIATIKSTLLKPSLTSFFEVKIGIPPGLSSWIGIRERDLNLLCSEVDLPGSQLVTTDITNDFHGVTERRAYRRVFEEETNFTFYVDSTDYTPVKFFERWIEYISNGVGDQAAPEDLKQNNYFYRMRYPDQYIAGQGLKVTKFERDHLNPLTYEFVRSFPLAISSMPVSYDGSSLLKCTVSMSYVRYVVKNLYVQSAYPPSNPFQQSQFNLGGFLGNLGGGLVDNVVDRVTGSDLLGDIAGGLANQAIRDSL